jgi:chromosome partitioning protein
MAAIVIALVQQKGGVAKTTLAGNLAAELLAMGLLVAVVDADPQGTMTTWAGLGEGILAHVVTGLDTTKPKDFRARVDGLAAAVDRVILDTPPGFRDAALLATLVADVVLLPVGPSPFDLVAVQQALDLVHEVQAKRAGLPKAFLVPCRVTPTSLGRDLPTTLAALGEIVLPAISQRAVVAQVTLTGQTVAEAAPNTLAGAEFKTLAQALEALL